MREKQSGRPGVMLYFDTFSPVLALDDVQLASLVRGIVTYAQTGKLPELEAAANMAFLMLRAGIDRDGERYEDKRIHARYMTYKREAEKRDEAPMSEDEYRRQLEATDSNSRVLDSNCQLLEGTEQYLNSSINSSINSSPKVNLDLEGDLNSSFVPPTLAEVTAFCQERKSPVDPRRFFDYFTENEWRDRDGRTVRSWRQKLIAWEAYEPAKKQPSGREALEELWEEFKTVDAGSAYQLPEWVMSELTDGGP